MNNFRNQLRLFKSAVLKLAYLEEYINNVTRYQVVKNRMVESMMNSRERGVSDQFIGDRELVVSLTSYGKRINTVFQAIESIFLQSLKPNRVILYLGENEFALDNLPLSLKKQMERGLEVRFVKDIRAYTKLVPALREFPDAVIITVDDDYMYPFDMIEGLMSAYQENSKAVCCYNSRVLKLKSDSELEPYNSFKMSFPKKNELSMQLMAEGFGGVLYPPHVMHEDVCKEELFMKLSPYADDLWFKAMQLLVDTPVLQIARNHSWFHTITSEASVQDIGLVRYNNDQNGNDPQLKAIFDFYKIYNKLK